MSFVTNYSLKKPQNYKVPIFFSLSGSLALDEIHKLPQIWKLTFVVNMIRCRNNNFSEFQVYGCKNFNKIYINPNRTYLSQSPLCGLVNFETMFQSLKRKNPVLHFLVLWFWPSELDHIFQGFVLHQTTLRLLFFLINN